jgi:hypothetical protein
MASYFFYISIVVADALALIFFNGALGVSEYSYAGMAVLLTITGLIMAWVGLAKLQTKSPRVAFNGSDKAWSYSGNTYRFKADGEDWIIVRIGTGYGAGLGFILAKEGTDTVCMKAKRVRWAAFPHIFSPAWYKKHPAGFVQANYPQLHSQITSKFRVSGGDFWLEYKYDPKDDLNMRGDIHPITDKPLTADSLKAGLKIGSVNAAGKRNTLITELVDRVTLIDETISYVTDRIQTIEDKISHSASNIELLLSDLKRAKRNNR